MSQTLYPHFTEEETERLIFAQDHRVGKSQSVIGTQQSASRACPVICSIRQPLLQ